MNEGSREFIRKSIIGNTHINVREVEDFFVGGYEVVRCPICKCETLDSYWICEECGWEYDGCKKGEEYSTVNNATVKEYRAEYRKIKAEIDKEKKQE